VHMCVCACVCVFVCVAGVLRLKWVEVCYVNFGAFQIFGEFALKVCVGMCVCMCVCVCVCGKCFQVKSGCATTFWH